MSSRRKFLCMDCRIDTGKTYEHYMLIDTTWVLIHNSNRGMLCIGCCEARLGRQLTAWDFNSSHVNNPKLHQMSDRLRSRLNNANTDHRLTRLGQC